MIEQQHIPVPEETFSAAVATVDQREVNAPGLTDSTWSGGGMGRTKDD